AAASSSTASYTDSQSDLESGSEVSTDPTGGPPLAGSYTIASLTTSYAFNQNAGAENFAAGGVVSGGNNSCTFVQKSSDSHNLTLTTTSVNLIDTGYDTLSESMAGTETYGTGGTISGGSDSFNWGQTASDNLIAVQIYGGTTLGAYTLYNVTLNDI